MEIENAIRQHAEKDHSLSLSLDEDDDFDGLTKGKEDHKVILFFSKTNR